MSLRLLTIAIKWGLSLSLLSGLLFGLYLVRERMQTERAGEESEEKTAAQQRGENGLVKLEEEETERYGLKTERARSVRWCPHRTVYGRVVPNPQATVEIRSPLAGTLQAARGTVWPALGQRVRAGETIGALNVRVGPEVRLDLQNKLADARIRQRGAEEEVQIEQDRAKSLRRVTSQEIIARSELDAALIHLAQARTQLATAKASVELWQQALEEIEKRTGKADSSWSLSFMAPADGEVTEVAGRLGMVVEAGSPILTLVDFRRPLFRLDIPPELLTSGGPPQHIDVRKPSASPLPLSGVVAPPSPTAELSESAKAYLVGPASRVDPVSQFVSYWYEVRLTSQGSSAAARESEEKNTRRSLYRPGMQVIAEVKTGEAAAQPAVTVAAGAVLYHEGRPLVYVRIEPEKFQRREVCLLGREGDRWVVSVRQGNLAIGVAPDEAVVSRHAQVLLSKEFLVGGTEND